MSTKSYIVKHINKILNLFGAKLVSKSYFRDWPSFFVYIKSRGVLPRIVIDVGVATDTMQLYKAFPRAKLLLVEPCVEFKESLERLKIEYDVDYVLAAAGASSGTMKMMVSKDLGGSSFFKPREMKAGYVDMVPRTVPVVTLDELWSERQYDGPAILKVDVQGGELEVLKGAKNVLTHCELVILETMLVDQYIGAPILYDYIFFMKARGFVLFDVIGVGFTPASGVMGYLDLVFTKEASQLRDDKRWLTKEQAKKIPLHYKGVSRKN
jgi:FkbM family methyltransferase